MSHSRNLPSSISPNVANSILLYWGFAWKINSFSNSISDLKLKTRFAELQKVLPNAFGHKLNDDNNFGSTKPNAELDNTCMVGTIKIKMYLFRYRYRYIFEDSNVGFHKKNSIPLYLLILYFPIFPTCIVFVLYREMLGLNSKTLFIWLNFKELQSFVCRMWAGREWGLNQRREWHGAAAWVSVQWTSKLDEHECELSRLTETMAIVES